MLSANLHRRHLARHRRRRRGQCAGLARAQIAPAESQDATKCQIGRSIDSLPDERQHLAPANDGSTAGDKVAKADPEPANKSCAWRGFATGSSRKGGRQEKPTPNPKFRHGQRRTPPSCLPRNADRERIAEIARDAQEAIEDHSQMAAIFEADDRLAAAMAEIKAAQG